MWFRPASSIIPIRAFQYACADYVDRLEEHGVEISMSRKGAPWENAKAESFIKTLKAEEVWLNQYRDLEHAQPLHRRLSGRGVQSPPAALLSWVSAAGHVRGQFHRAAPDTAG